MQPLDLLCRVLLGEPAPPGLQEALAGITDPDALRLKLLRDNGIAEQLPEFRYAVQCLELRAVARGGGPIRLVLGAAGTRHVGWVSTNRDTLDLLKPEAWRAWLEEGSVSAMLAEHVWEHLSAAQGLAAARTCHRYLAPGGYIRLAVPDALMPDPEYKRICGLGGPHGHQCFHDHRSLTAMFEEAGFRVTVLEHWDEAGGFHTTPWNNADGFIGRCARHDRRNQDGVLRFTSLVIDAHKPA